MSYWKRWYAKNKKRFFALVNKNKKQRRKQFQEIIDKAKDKPCIICGMKFHPVAMDLYHRDGEDRKFRISQAKRLIYNIQKLIDEIAKCDVYCANCRVIVDTEKATKERSVKELSTKNRRSFLRAALRALKNAPCADCEKIYPSYAMELDHISGDKVDGITRLINIDAPIDKIQEELCKVELVCANCHRIRTFNRRNNGS